eukprot:SM000152S01573  [mRNA]  locus=s152:302099:303317:- [translate_table: standard]
MPALTKRGGSSRAGRPRRCPSSGRARACSGVAGDITDWAYADDCVFVDPTVSFAGWPCLQAWKRNIRLLVPFLVEPSIQLLDIAQLEEQGAQVIRLEWLLRTYLAFPWRPLIAVKGSTDHTLDDQGVKVVGHEEVWEISALDAILQMFVPSDQAIWKC